MQIPLALVNSSTAMSSIFSNARFDARLKSSGIITLNPLPTRTGSDKAPEEFVAT